MSYEFLEKGQHMLTVRNRETNFAKQSRYWGIDSIRKVLNHQDENEDIYVTKYPKNRLVQFIILDFDSDDLSEAYDDVNRMRNYLKKNGHNCVIVSSGSKGYHLYIQIAPFLFKNTEYRQVSDWKSFFNAFVCFLIHDDFHQYKTLDAVNFSAGLNGNIRLINSRHPKTGNLCEIIEGAFVDGQSITRLQDEAQKKAYLKLEIVEQKQEQLKKTVVIDENDPIQNNDLREVFRNLTGDIKLYPKGYAYCCCPVHGDKHPSLLVTKEWFSCSACNFKGNIYTLRKMGFVEFGNDGKVK